MAAHAMSQVISVFIQLGTIPILLAGWGENRYGEWVLLSTIPAQLALSDLGFGSAAASDMTMKVGRGDREGALGTFQSTWVLVTALSIAACLTALIGLFFLPWYQWFNFQTVGRREAFVAGFLLIFQVLMQQQLSVATAAYSCDGHYARGIMASNLLRLFSTLGAMGFFIFHRESILWYAFGSTIVSLIVGIFTIVDMRRTVPWVKYGWAYASRTQIKALWSPAISFLGFPFGLVLGQQAVNLVIGRYFGAAEVTHFATLRTLSRVVVQCTSVFSAPFTVELSRTLGAEDYYEARRLHAQSCQASILSGLVLSTILALVGEPLYRLFTHGLEFNGKVFGVLLVLGVLNSLWTASCSVGISINRHQIFTVMFFVANALSFGVMLIAAPSFGLVGVAISLALVELVMNIYTVRNSLQHLRQTPGEFFRMLMQNPLPALTARFRKAR